MKSWTVYTRNIQVQLKWPRVREAVEGFQIWVGMLDQVTFKSLWFKITTMWVSSSHLDYMYFQAWKIRAQSQLTLISLEAKTERETIFWIW